MAHVIFYEKPGCINNTRQKKLLAEAGHDMAAHDLLTTEWSAESLKPFFDGYEVKQWFNRTAPMVKSGEVVPEELDEDEALALMVKFPLLIRRPLMMIEGECFVGFDADMIDALIGLAPIEGSKDLESCPRSHSEAICSTL